MIAHFFVDPDQVGPTTAVLSEEDSRHLVTVLRARPGDPVSVADGAGRVWDATFKGRAGERAEVTLHESRMESPRLPSFTVVHALPKQRKLDDVVQRLTELGVGRIVPVHSERSQVELDERKAAKAVARWRAVALAAAKQSRRARLPVVDPVGDWNSSFPAGSTGVVCWEESSVGLRAALGPTPTPTEFLLGIGPEGGLTNAEVAVTGLPHASLGATVLRTETAALVAVAALTYHYGLMEPA